MLSMKEAVLDSREQHTREISKKPDVPNADSARYKTKLLEEFSEQTKASVWVAWVCPF
jgi:hypothetical protein